MKALVATILFLLHVQSAWADCADLNRQAIPNKAALQAAAVDCNFEIGPKQPLIAVKRATMLLRFDWLLGLIGALLS